MFLLTGLSKARLSGMEDFAGLRMFLCVLIITLFLKLFVVINIMLLLGFDVLMLFLSLLVVRYSCFLMLLAILFTTHQSDHAMFFMSCVFFLLPSETAYQYFKNVIDKHVCRLRNPIYCLHSAFMKTSLIILILNLARCKQMLWWHSSVLNIEVIDFQVLMQHWLCCLYGTHSLVVSIGISCRHDCARANVVGPRGCHCHTCLPCHWSRWGCESCRAPMFISSHCNMTCTLFVSLMGKPMRLVFVGDRWLSCLVSSKDHSSMVVLTHVLSLGTWVLARLLCLPSLQLRWAFPHYTLFNAWWCHPYQTTWERCPVVWLYRSLFRFFLIGARARPHPVCALREWCRCWCVRYWEPYNNFTSPEFSKYLWRHINE